MDADLPIPPEHLRFMDAYVAAGDSIAAQLADFAVLDPSDEVLEIGSGYGRVAAGLWRRGHRARYVGMDILKGHIEWCTENMSPATDGLYAFHHIDVRNDRYNPNGALQATDLTLDLDFDPDVVLLASVFTHLYAGGIVHYLREISHILPQNGRIMATFFLINESQERAESAGLSKYPLGVEISDTCRSWSSDDPLHVIAYDERWLHRQIEATGLKVQATYLGEWCGRGKGRTFQDTLILVRADAGNLAS